MAILKNQRRAYTVLESWTALLASYDLHAVNTDRFVIEDVAGAKNALFTVNAGDKFNGSSGERSEVVLGGYQNSRDFLITGLETEPEFYRFKIKLSSPWVVPDVNQFGYQWGLCFQVHGPNYWPISPPLALHCEDEFKLFMLGGDINNLDGGFIPLVNTSLVVDAWVDFVIEVKWSTGSDGYAAVYRKDEGATAFTLMGESRNRPTLQWDTTPKNHPHYLKTGFYRSESDHTNAIRIGPLTRTTKRDLAFL